MISEQHNIVTEADINVPLGSIFRKFTSLITNDNHHYPLIKLPPDKSNTLHPSVVYLLRRVAPDKSTLLNLAVPCLKSFLNSDMFVSSYGETLLFPQNHFHCSNYLRMDLPTYKYFTSFKKLYPGDKKLLCNGMSYWETVKPTTLVSIGLQPYSAKLGHPSIATDITSSLALENEFLYHQLYVLNNFDVYKYSYDDMSPYSSTRITPHKYANSTLIYDVYLYSYDKESYL